MWTGIKATVLPESIDSCSWGPSDHSVFLEVSPAFTSQDREKVGEAFCLSVKPSLPFYRHFLNWFLPLSYPKRLSPESQYQGQCPAIPVIAWLRAILLPFPSFHGHIVSSQRETRWQIFRCGWETLPEVSPLEAKQPTLMMVVPSGS